MGCLVVFEGMKAVSTPNANLKGFSDSLEGFHSLQRRPSDFAGLTTLGSTYTCNKDYNDKETRGSKGV